jgi:hypothetical protein
MRKLVAGALIAALAISVLPSAALAGDTHAVRNRWAGAAIGAGALIAGAAILNALSGAPAAAPAPVVHTPPPVVYSPPPVVYTPPPVVYVPPRVVYHPPVVVRPPVVIHRPAPPPGYWHRANAPWKHPFARDGRGHDGRDWRRHR